MIVPRPDASVRWYRINRIVLLLIVVLTSTALAQIDSVRVIRDSRFAYRPFVGDSIPNSSSSALRTNHHQTKSPLLAIGLSALVPGSGQIYNTDYWKAPVIWGLGGYWIYEWNKLNNLYKNYQSQYTESLVSNPPNGIDSYRSNRDFYKDERDKFAWFLGALYFVNILDAYVGAQLYDFDVSPDLGFDGRIEPRVTATVRLRF